MDVLDILGKKRSIEVLLEVYDNPGIIQSQIADKKESGSGSKRQRLSELIGCGLVRTESDPNNWSAIRYYLTDEGQRVAQHLIRIRNGREVDPIDYDAPAQEGHTVG